MQLGSITISLTVSLYFGGFITSQFEDPQTSYLVILFTALAIGIVGIIYALFMEQSLQIEKEKRTAFFQLSSITDCFRTIFKVKENRVQKLVVTFVFFSLNICFITPEFEYMMGRLKYKDFDRSLFNYYSGSKNALDGLSTLLVLPAILTFFPITDLALIIFGLISTSIGYLLIMLSDESWPGAAFGWPLWTLCLTYRCFANPICATLTHVSRSGLIATACRSSMTKLVSPRDIGKPFDPSPT